MAGRVAGGPVTARRDISRPDLTEDGGPSSWTMAAVERNTVIRRVLRSSGVPAVLVALAVVTGACSPVATQLEDHNLIEQGNAVPAESPPADEPETGVVVSDPGSVRALMAAGDRVVAQVDDPPGLQIGRVDGTRWVPEDSVEL